DPPAARGLRRQRPERPARLRSRGNAHCGGGRASRHGGSVRVEDATAGWPWRRARSLRPDRRGSPRARILTHMTSSLFSVEGRIAVVTGGLGQLGREYTRALAGAGARVAVIDVTDDASRLHSAFG